MNRRTAQLAENNRRYGHELEQMPMAAWPVDILGHPQRPVEIWRSFAFLVQVFKYEGSTRLTVNRTTFTGAGWTDGISWDDLQRLKRECGRGDSWAVECYPPDADMVCDANMRHLWLLDEPPPYGWRT